MVMFIAVLFSCSTRVKAPFDEIVSLPNAQRQANRILDEQVYPDRVLVGDLQTIQIGSYGRVFTASPSEYPIVPIERMARVTSTGIEVLLPFSCSSLVFFAKVASEDLISTTTQKTILESNSASSIEQLSIYLAPGFPVNIDQCIQSKCKVQLDNRGYALASDQYEVMDDNISASGWVDEADLGIVFRADDFVIPDTNSCVSIDGHSGSLMTFNNSKDWPVTEHENGSITLHQNRIQVRGNLSPTVIHRTQCLASGAGGGCGWGISHTRYIHLHRGTPVFDQAFGTVVGVVGDDDVFQLLQEKSGWAEITAPNKWDELSFWVDNSASEFTISTTK
jgi:hypothetical protein